MRMVRGVPKVVAVVMCLGLLAPLGPWPVHAQETTLPLPRFASLKADEVNLRTGPGMDYPIEWVYKRRHLPVEITAEFEQWRRIRDYQGTVGWIHQALLSGKRSAIVLTKERMLLRKPHDGAQPVLRAAPGVHVGVLTCTGIWCLVEASGTDGWVHQTALWGVYENEVIE